MAAGGAATPVAVGVDIGGTKMLGAVVDGTGTILRRRRIPTPERADDRIDAIVDLVASLVDGDGAIVLPVGVGVAGLVDVEGNVRYTPNLDWREAPLRSALNDRLDTVVTVENDAGAAAWAEYRFGAARDARGGAMMLTLGTGVGGGLVMDGRPVRGARGFAAEFGHIVLDEDGPRCPCGNIGCLEALASGKAIGRAAREAVAAGDPPAGSALAGRDDASGEDVTAAAQAGDDTAVGILARAGHWLGIGVASLVNALDPEIVVLGGGVMDAAELLLDPTLDAYGEHVMAREHRRVPDVVVAELGNDAGVIGAAALAASIADPA